MNKTEAARKKAQWLANCLENGWGASELDGLSEVWDTFRDEYGNSKPKKEQSPIPSPSVSGQLEKDEWIKITEGCIMPEVGEEFNVVWDLGDGGKPVVTTMEWNAIGKKWEDHRGEPTATQRVTHYRPLPELPIN